jgi:hypothetical protein
MPCCGGDRIEPPWEDERFWLEVKREDDEEEDDDDDEDEDEAPRIAGGERGVPARLDE